MGVFVIAEAGVNHNGSLKIAKELVDAAKYAGADCIKFQTFIAEMLVSKDAVKAEYQINNTGKVDSQYEMLKKLERSYSDFKLLQEYCTEKNILFLSTPFDLESIEFLMSIHIPLWKIPSGEITNLPYLEKVAKTKLPVIMSTGMCVMGEVERAIEILRKYGCLDITLLHCTTEYPTPYNEVNLNAILNLKHYFNLPVGYSDHTKGTEIAIAAAAIGAVVIEKHFTLDKNMDGPDHKASLNPDELKYMISSIRHIEQAMGTGEKVPSESERKNIAIARKSIVASRPIKKGEFLTSENLAVKRPGTGISPMKWYEVLGQEAKQNFEEDELIQL